MKYQLGDLLDIPRLQSTLDSLYLSSKIPSAIIDNDGIVHTGSGWQDVCAKFHRVHPEARKRCVESDIYINDHIHEANPSIAYKCPHGLVDAATPIIIEGEHLGNVFTGQLFLEEPDLEYFRAQAKSYGFDEEEYIDAVNKVPIIPEQAFQENLAFVAHLTGMLAEMGLKRAKEEEAGKRLRESEERYREVVEGLPDIVMRFDRDGRHLFVSDNVSNVVDLPAERFIGKTHSELGFPEPQYRFWEEAIRGVFDSGAPYETEFTLECKQGPVIFNWRLVPERDAQGVVQSVLSFKRDITEHRRAEESLRESEAKYRSLFEHMQEGCAYCRMIFENGDPVDFTYVSVNAAFETLTGLKDVAGKRVSEVIPGIRSSDPALFEAYGRVARTGKPEKIEIFVEALHQWYSISVYSPGQGYFVAVFDVITDRKRAEVEKKKLQAQLLQAMKMEAVGRLAGGVAHDFNNLLTVITGYSELLLQEIGKESPMHREVEEIKRAGERAALLTQQLLAFSRKQIIEPKVVHLDHLVAEMHKMLSRLIGEDIALQATTGKSLGSVMIDPGQFQQILMNLVVNARDAMPDGGKIVIETANVDLDEGYSALHPYVNPGRFVMLSVSDSGKGMSAEVMDHIFEPFFTTKERGSGTGLGLATTYGIVKQAGGSIEVYSEVGTGTTFKIYLPRVEAGEAQPENDGRQPDLPAGTETVLIVEDEGKLRELCVRILGRLGYKVLQAGNGTEAIAEAQGYGDRIDLLLTDVVMPGMNGNELATQLILHHPGMKVLFTSGYTENVISHHGVLAEGVSFIGKPYTLSALATKVREVLGKA